MTHPAGQLYTERYYPCGCKAVGPGDVSPYCPQHEPIGVERSLTVIQTNIHAWANNTFPDRVAENSISKLVLEEIPEMLQHKKVYGRVGIAMEVADCFILLLDICSIWGIDAAQAIHDKMEINIRRKWVKDEASGFYNHVTQAPDILVEPTDSEGGEP